MRIERPQAFLRGISPSIVWLGPDKRAASQGRAEPTSWTQLEAVEVPDGSFILCSIPFGMVVLDVDDPTKVPWSWMDPATLQVQTPRGRHYWYRLPPGLALPHIAGLTSPTPLLLEGVRMSGDDVVVERSADLCTVGGYATIPPTEGYSVAHEALPTWVPTPLVVHAVELAAAMAPGL